MSRALHPRRAAGVLLGVAALLAASSPAAYAGDPGDWDEANTKWRTTPPLIVPPYGLPDPLGAKWLTDKEYEQYLDQHPGVISDEDAFGDGVMPDGDGETVHDGEAPDVWFGALLAALLAKLSAAPAVAGQAPALILAEASPMGGLLVGNELCQKWDSSLCPAAGAQERADERELERLQAWADAHPSGSGLPDVPAQPGGGAGGVGGGAGWEDPAGGAEGAGGIAVPSGSGTPDAPGSPEQPGGVAGDGEGDTGSAVDVEPAGLDGAGDTGSAIDYDADTDVYDAGVDTTVYDDIAGGAGGGLGGGGTGSGSVDGWIGEAPEYVDPEKGGAGAGWGGAGEGEVLDDDDGDGGSSGENGSSEDNSDSGPNSSEGDGDEGAGSGSGDDGGEDSDDDSDDDGSGDDCSGADCDQSGDDDGGYPNPDDPSGGCIGPQCRPDVSDRGEVQSNPAELVENPNPDGGGPDGPVVHEGDGSLVMNPNPEEGGPVGPAVHSGGGSLVMNPDPDGGGPVGPAVTPAGAVAGA